MMKILFAAVIAAAAAVSSAAQPKPCSASKKQTKILMIGNSFSISCIRQMPQIAQSLGIDLDVCSLYIGGCSLARHVKNIENASNPAHVPYRVDRFVNGKEVRSPRMEGYAPSNIPQMLAADKWDIVTIQQVSHESWRPESYSPAGDRLIAKVRELAPQAEIVVQQTWSYTPWDRRLARWKMDQNEMYAKLKVAYEQFAGRYGFRLIPMGTAVQEWRRRLPVKYTENSYGGDVVGGGSLPPSRHFKLKDGKWVPDSDCFHLSEAGQYYQALLWTAFLLGADVTPCAYRPAFVSAADAELMKRIVMDIVRTGTK